LHVPPIRKSLCLVREPAGRDDEPSCGALSSHGPVQLSHHVYANALRTPLLALHKVQFTVAPQFQINSSVWSSLPGFADLKALPAKTFAHQLLKLLPAYVAEGIGRRVGRRALQQLATAAALNG
jgi:hypothetical protein